MLQKFKITTCAFILCLFGLTLTAVSPVFGAKSAAFDECTKMKGKGVKKAKLKCFADLAQSILPLGDNTGRLEACQRTKGLSKHKQTNCYRKLAQSLQDEEDARRQAKDDQRESDKAEAKLWDGKDSNGGTWYALDVEGGPTWKNEKGEECRMVRRRIPGSGQDEQISRQAHPNWFTLAEECEPKLRTTNMDGTQRTIEQELEAEMLNAMGGMP
jgi:hypothetical protein